MFAVFALIVFLLPFLERLSLRWSYLLILLLSVPFFFIKRKSVLIVILILCSLINLQWGLAQFVTQSDVNLIYLGESRLGSDITGVAKFGVDKIVRPYGPYMHANSFAGIAVMTLVLMVGLVFKSYRYSVWRIVFMFIGLTILVSFSRAATLSLFLVVLMVLRHDFFRRFYIGSVLVLLIISVLFLPFWLQRFEDVEDKGFEDRFSGYGWSKQIIVDNFWGVGVGNYKSELQAYFDRSGVVYEPWDVDFVHSVPLLIIATIGFLPALLFFSLVFYLFIRKNNFYRLLLVSLLPIMLLDHYLLTQATPLLYLVLLMII